MANIATLAVQLTARTAPFSASMKSAAGPVRAFSGVVGAASARLAGFFGALAAGVTVGAGIRFVKNQAEMLDKLGKTSDQLGINATKLRAYEIGARKAGVEGNALTSGLTKFSQALSRAAEGEKTYQDIFKRLNLDPKVLLNSGVDTALKTTADALAGIANQTDKLSTSTELFGRTAGRSFLSFLEDGGAGLDAMEDDARRLGVAFDRVDIAEVEAANDAFEDIKIAMENVGAIVAIKVAPIITDLSTRFAEAVAQGTKFGDKVTGALRWVAKGVALVMDGWKVFNIAVKLSQATLLAWIDLALKGFNLVIRGANAISEQMNKVLPKSLQIGKIDTLDPLIDAFEDQIKDIGDQIQTMISEGWSISKVDDWFDNIIAKSREAAEARVRDNDIVGRSLDKVAEKAKDDQSFAQVNRSDAANYLRNVARGTALNGTRISGPRDLGRVQQVSDPELKKQTAILSDIADNTEDNYAMAS